MNIEIHQKGEETSWDKLAKLFQEAFQERLDQGLHFICSDFTPEYLEQHSPGSTIFVAIDKDNGALAGAAFLKIKNDNGENWGYLSNMAISPSYKRCGIGSKLVAQRIAVAKANDCKYVLSDTAVGATSSVNWHFKNGFSKIKLLSWPNTNYYSYLFRKQLVPDSKWDNPLYCKWKYCLSALKCRFYYTAKGDIRFPELIKLYHKLRGVA